ncbi:prepilin-type N-terminal cleavage/methylation domain-containing protein [Niveispirillum sp. KHB5.9]|uniref:prepilin-type N-terminal cleavage/methylation domain-containing protein n=1 Tax=Niveispirillum sp. KHB5.9 TaxID=3400269 RepID=UPI003A874A99
MGNRRGFTLLESLLALAIFGLGAALLADGALAGARAARQGWNQAAAWRLALSTADRLGVDLLPTRERLDISVEGQPFRLRIEPMTMSGGVEAFRIEVRHRDDPDRVLASLPAQAYPMAMP